MTALFRRAAEERRPRSGPEHAAAPGAADAEPDRVFRDFVRVLARLAGRPAEEVPR